MQPGYQQGQPPQIDNNTGQKIESDDWPRVLTVTVTLRLNPESRRMGKVPNVAKDLALTGLAGLRAQGYDFDWRARASYGYEQSHFTF